MLGTFYGGHILWVRNPFLMVSLYTLVLPLSVTVLDIDPLKMEGCHLYNKYHPNITVKHELTIISAFYHYVIAGVQGTHMFASVSLVFENVLAE